MNKHGIRLISFILALFSFIMIFQNLMNDQQQLPLGTTEQLVLNIAETGTTKEQLISELDNITNKHNATLVKVVIPSDEYKNKKFNLSKYVSDNNISKVLFLYEGGSSMFDQYDYDFEGRVK